ncbi:MAG: hypothetical protein JW791_01720 [Nanoarchaeota archaeon]|nr:hypothetical protein [Nanoarchaeota archaeon]
MSSEVINQLLNSRKYSGICRDTITRTVNNLAGQKIRGRNLIKRVKEDLYKIHTNYYKNFDYKQALFELEKAYSSKDENIVLGTHDNLMRRYDNNRLLTVQEGLYDEIFKITGKPEVLLDLACGLNPLTIPWMKLSNKTEYYCYDIEKSQISFLNDYFKLLKKRYKAYCQDVITKTPVKKADVAFLFKSTTCFEWQREGNTLKVLNNLNSKWVALTLMLRGEKNIPGSRNYFNNLLKNLPVKRVEELIFKKEYVYLIKLNK